MNSGKQFKKMLEKEAAKLGVKILRYEDTHKHPRMYYEINGLQQFFVMPNATTCYGMDGYIQAFRRAVRLTKEKK